MTVQVQCAECGAQITKPWPSAIRDRNFCNLTCLGRYRSKHYVGDKAANWRGGVSIERNRVRLHRPNHPAAHRDGYVYRYRLVAEEMVGRLLLPDEVVHHIDGDETNDDPSNLQVMTQAEHARLYDANRRANAAV